MAGLPEIWVAGAHEFGHRLCARDGYVPLFTGRWGGADWAPTCTEADCEPASEADPDGAAPPQAATASSASASTAAAVLIRAVIMTQPPR